MRIQAGHHATDGFGDQFLLVNGLHVVTFDHAEHGCQLLQFLERQRGHVASCHGLQRHSGHGARKSAYAEPSDDLEFLSHFGECLCNKSQINIHRKPCFRGQQV